MDPLDEVGVPAALHPLSALWDVAPPPLRFSETQSETDLYEDTRTLTQLIVLMARPQLAVPKERNDAALDSVYGAPTYGIRHEKPVPWWVVWYNIVTQRLQRAADPVGFDALVAQVVRGLPEQPEGHPPLVSPAELVALFDYVSGGVSASARPGRMDPPLSDLRRYIRLVIELAPEDDPVRALEPLTWK